MSKIIGPEQIRIVLCLTYGSGISDMVSTVTKVDVCTFSCTLHLLMLLQTSYGDMLILVITLVLVGISYRVVGGMESRKDDVVKRISSKSQGIEIYVHISTFCEKLTIRSSERPEPNIPGRSCQMVFLSCPSWKTLLKASFESHSEKYKFKLNKTVLELTISQLRLCFKECHGISKMTSEVT